MPEPPASSVPDQLTVKMLGEFGGRAVTRLVGGPASTVLKRGALSMGALLSNTTVAWALIRVPVVSVVLGWTV
jgi:hypothetical protein